MSLIDKLIKEEKSKKKRKRILFLSLVTLMIIVFCLKECENKIATNKPKQSKSELQKTKTLDFKNIESGKTDEQELKLKSYKLLIVSSLKRKIESSVDFEKCNIESEINWVFRWYPKTGEIENSEFTSTGGQISKKLEACLGNEVSNLRIEIKNNLEIAYIRLDLKIK